jgi:hypothetical protein
MYEYTFTFKGTHTSIIISDIDVNLHAIRYGDPLVFDNFWVNTTKLETIKKREVSDND